MSERALELAYRYLSRRERTVHELHEHLASRGIDEPAIAGAIQELSETGLLDDERYARLFVEDKRGLEEWGTARIRRTLITRGVERDVIEATLCGDPGDELGRALALLERRFPNPPADRRDRERALGVLIRRGYEPELALDALAAHARTRA